MFNNMKRRAQAALYSIFVLAYLGFLLYFLTIQPGGADGNPAVIWAITGFASGGMIMMAVYAFTLYLFRRREKASLYFALYCIGSGARFLMMDGSLTLMGLVRGLDYNALASVRYLAMGLQVVGYISFIFEVFAEPKHKKRLPYLNAAQLLLSGLAAVFAAYGTDFVQLANLSILLVTLISVGYGIFLVARPAKLRRNKLHLLYLATLTLYSVNPFLSLFMRDVWPHTNIISSTVFVIAHIVLLSDRYARAITAVERSNEALEEKVAERTAELLCANEHLAERNVSLDNLNRTKTEFLQDMSHEMKAPLTVIATGIDFADMQIHKESADLERAAAALDNIREETQRLGRMVGGMVSLASMSEISENRKRIDFAALLRNSAETFRPALEQRNNRLSVEIAPDLPDVFVESDRFAQVIANLLSNAAEYTRDGQLTLSADYDSAFITVRVSDTGDGIERSLLPKVFKRGVSGRDGTGYGLYICKTVVEAHGGTINIESEPGKGTTVTFTVPVYGGQEAGHRL